MCDKEAPWLGIRVRGTVLGEGETGSENVEGYRLGQEHTSAVSRKDSMGEGVVWKG